MSGGSRSPLVRRAASLAASQAVARLADLVVAILLVRALRPAEWSAIALLLSIYAAATTFGGLSLPQGIPFFLRRLPPAERRGFAVQTVVLLALAGLLTAAAILAARPLLADSAFAVGPALPWLALAVLLEVPTLATPQLLVAVERVPAAAGFVGGAALARVTLVTLPLLLGRGLTGAALGLLLYAAGRLVLTLVLLPRITPPGPLRLPGARIGEQLRYTAPLGLAVAAASLNAQVGKWLVAILDPARLGAFAIAATEVPLIPILAYSTGAVLATRLVHAFHRERPAEARAYWLAATARLAQLVVPLTLGLVLIAPQLLPMLFGNRYPEAVLPFQLTALILLHRVADYGGMLRAAGDPGSLWRASLVLLGANLALGLGLTASFGMLGMAAATLAANLVAWLFVLHRIAGRLGGTLATAFPWRGYGRILLAALAAALGALALTSLLPDAGVVQLPARLVLFAAGYAALARVLGLARNLPPVPADPADFAEAAEPAAALGSPTD